MNPKYVKGGRQDLAGQTSLFAWPLGDQSYKVCTRAALPSYLQFSSWGFWTGTRQWGLETMSCHSWRKTAAVGKPSMTTINSYGKSSSSKDVSYSSSLQMDKGGQPAASSKRQFRFSKEPHEEVATLRKCSNREAGEGISISGEKLECLSPLFGDCKLMSCMSYGANRRTCSY